MFRSIFSFYGLSLATILFLFEIRLNFLVFCNELDYLKNTGFLPYLTS